MEITANRRGRQTMHRGDAQATSRSQHRVQLVSAIILIVVGCGVLIAGFVVPPLGRIDPSILIAFGEILTFVGALFGIDYHYRQTTIHH